MIRCISVDAVTTLQAQAKDLGGNRFAQVTDKLAVKGETKTCSPKVVAQFVPGIHQRFEQRRKLKDHHGFNPSRARAGFVSFDTIRAWAVFR